MQLSPYTLSGKRRRLSRFSCRGRAAELAGGGGAGQGLYLRNFARSFDAGDRSVGDSEKRVEVNLKFALKNNCVLCTCFITRICTSICLSP